MLKKLLGKKKDKEYFLEIEDKKPAPAPAPVAAAEKADNITTETSEAKSETVAKPVESKSSYTVSYDPPEWVKAIKNYSDVESKSENKGLGFASNYLITNVPLARRRPGPSLNKFKEMARTMR